MAFQTELSNLQKKLEMCWGQKFTEFEKRFDAAATSNNPTLLQLQEEFKAFKDLVINMIQVLGQQICNNARAIDVLDMKSRRKVLLFHGIPEDDTIGVEQKVLSILHDKMGMSQVTSTSFKRCHRFGVPSSGKGRSILVHFHDYQIKADVWRSKSKLKGTSITVSEFLTKQRQAVHKRAKTHFNIRNVWTLDGIINIKVPGGNHVKVITDDELDSVIEMYSAVESSSSVQPSSLSIPSRQPEVRGKQPVRDGKVQTEDSKRSRRAAPKK